MNITDLLVETLNKNFQGKEVVFTAPNNSYRIEGKVVSFQMDGLNNLVVGTENQGEVIIPLYFDIKEKEERDTPTKVLHWKELIKVLTSFKKRGVDYTIYNEKRSSFRRVKIAGIFCSQLSLRREFIGFLESQGFTKEVVTFKNLYYYSKNYSLEG